MCKHYAVVELSFLITISGFILFVIFAGISRIMIAVNSCFVLLDFCTRERIKYQYFAAVSICIRLCKVEIVRKYNEISTTD